jgi:fibronectin type 3 domain-containing protein
VTGYKLYRIAGASPDPKIMTFDYSIKGYMDIEVKNGINYRYYLTALNQMGESPPTPEVNATPMTYPGEVTVFTAEAGDGFVHLYWDAPEDNGGAPVLNYTILRALNNNSQWTKIVVDGDDLDHNDTSVLNGQLYRYKINVRNAVGATRFTEEIAAYPVAKPSPPENVQISMSYGTVRLTWEKPLTDGGDKIKFYTIYRMTLSLWNPLDSPDYTELSYTDTTVQNGRNYRYVVTASNEIGESAYSSEVNITPLGRPGSPLHLVLTPGDRVVGLVWEPPMDNGGTPIIKYNILRGEDVSQLVLIKSVEPDGTEYSDTTVKNGKTYYYLVKAENSIGEGAGSSIEMVKPAGVPSPPSNVRVVGGNKYVEIAWGAPTKNNGNLVTEVRIYRGTDRNATAILMNTTLLQGTYRDSTVVNGIAYFYRMTAVNGVGESEGSPPIEATPLGRPSEVRSLTVSSSVGSVELRWQPPLDYKIFRSSGTGSVLLAEIDGSLTEYVDRTASGGKSYLYRVVAVNALGEGSDIAPIEVEVKEEKGLDPLLIAIPAIVIILIVIGVVLAFYMTRSKKGEAPHHDQLMMQPGMVLPQPQVYQSQMFQGQILQPLEPPAPAPELPSQETPVLPPAEPITEPQAPVSYPPAEAPAPTAPEQTPDSATAPEDPMMAFYKPPEQS